MGSPDLQKIVVLCLVGLVVIFGGHQLAQAPDQTQIEPPSLELDTGTEDIYVEEFKFALEEAVRIEIGQPIEGYEPAMFIQVFPGLEEVDFNDVEAQIGVYKYRNGELEHEIPQDVMVHSAAPAVTDKGIATLLENVLDRLELDSKTTTVEQVVERLRHKDRPTTDDGQDNLEAELVACTMDAKMCPDGSFVGRVGPNCEFDLCPIPEENETPKQITCTPESKQTQACTREYRPVCGLVEVQCITTPCNPVPQTFGNACGACSQGNVVSYTEGECEDY